MNAFRRLTKECYMRSSQSARDSFVARILAQLVAALPGSTAVLRGSLAEGRQDCYSDIDVLWEVPDAQFDGAVNQASAFMAAVQPVESVRSDPEFQRSMKRRLLFIRFADVPLFWRLDLEIFAESVDRNLNYDVDNPLARGTDWSLAESALANGVAAIKAHLRRDEASAHELLSRAYERVGLPLPHGGFLDQLLGLVLGMPAIEPSTAVFACRIRELILQSFSAGNQRACCVELPTE